MYFLSGKTNSKFHSFQFHNPPFSSLLLCCSYIIFNTIFVSTNYNTFLLVCWQQITPEELYVVCHVILYHTYTSIDSSVCLLTVAQSMCLICKNRNTNICTTSSYHNNQYGISIHRGCLIDLWYILFYFALITPSTNNRINLHANTKQIKSCPYINIQYIIKTLFDKSIFVVITNKPFISSFLKVMHFFTFSSSCIFKFSI